MLLILGCKIYAYDHTIDAPALRGQNIKYFKTGLGFGENLKPLSKLISENKHKGVEIDYLKVKQNLKFKIFSKLEEFRLT